MPRVSKPWKIIAVCDPNLEHPIYGAQARAYEIGMNLLLEMLGEILEEEYLLQSAHLTINLTQETVMAPEG